MCRRACDIGIGCLVDHGCEHHVDPSLNCCKCCGLTREQANKNMIEFLGPKLAKDYFVDRNLMIVKCVSEVNQTGEGK